MRKVVFIADFATKKIGDVMECDSMLASQLVNGDRVARYDGEEAPKFEPKEDEETIVENEVVEAVGNEVNTITSETTEAPETKATEEEVVKVEEVVEEKPTKKAKK